MFLISSLLSLLPTLAILVLILLIAGGAFFVVQQQNAYIIERLGKYNRIVGPGFHFKIPILERVAAKVGMRTNQIDFSIDAKTKDNVTVTMDIAAQYHVSYDQEGSNAHRGSGVYRSYYMLSEPISQMRAYLIDALRSAVPGYTLDEVFDKKDSIASDVNATVSAMMREYGYDLVSTLITSIGLPSDVEQSMNKINAQSLAEAERIKIVTEAKASAEAMEEAGRGIAAQRKAIADGIAESLEFIKQSGVSTNEANELFLFTQWTDMMTEFARKGNASTIVLPSDFRETANMFDQITVAEEAKGK